MTIAKYLRQANYKEKRFIEFTILEIQGHCISINLVLVMTSLQMAGMHVGGRDHFNK
jgi:hypothetical protein